MVKVLIVQPDTASSGELARSLKSHDIECAIATTHKQAMRALDNDYLIDAVLVTMGQGSCCAGELLQAVRDNMRYQYLPVLMTCSGCAANLVVEALRRGATDVVSLPSTPAQIALRITSAIEKGKRRILVVDDEPVIRVYLTEMLMIERFSPIAVASGREALEVLEKTAVHAVISDIIMPGMNGMELLVEVKSKYVDVPVILITGYAGRYSPQETLAAGADGYFQKPFKNVDLIRTLRQVLSAHPQSRRSSAEHAQP